MKNNKKSVNKNRNIIIAIAAVVLVAAVIFIKIAADNKDTVPAIADIVIPKSDISDNVKFYPFKVGKTNMEVLAVKASDGTVRTAFNTCQVCNGSPKAYYKQEGNVLICQNCGNQFSMDMVEQQRGGCNPVPIGEENKSDDGTNIVISKAFIEQSKTLFTANWKTE